MKWNKFSKLAEVYPWLPKYINWNFDGRVVSQGGLKKFVRTKIGFIAFRPFEKLDQNATGSGKPFYSIHFRVETDDPVSGRSRVHSLGVPDDDRTVLHEIESIKRWHRDEEFPSSPLVFERVIKSTCTAMSDYYFDVFNYNIEIYEFPVSYRFAHPKSLPPPPALDPYEVACYRAYVDHTPIRPGRIFTPAR